MVNLTIDYESSNINDNKQNSNVVATIPGDFHIGQVLTGVGYRYDKQPTNGRITVIDYIPSINRKVIIVDQNISNAGAGFLDFGNGYNITIDNIYVITLYAGGDGVTGYLDVKAYDYAFPK